MPAKKNAARNVPAPADAPLDESLLSGELSWATRLAKPTTRGPASALPIGESSAREATRWLMGNFGPALTAAGKGTPFGAEILCAIVCQETAYFWLPLLRDLSKKAEFKENPVDLTDLIIARCVLDASGDHPDSPRSAFPKNTAAFEKKYGTKFTEMLVAEANLTRALRGYGPKRWVYKGYGIFQNDLQAVVENESFFREKKWYDFKNCLDRCMGELKAKLKAQGGDTWEAVRAYNGSGPRARQYRDNVKAFTKWTADEISKIPAVRTTRGIRGSKPASKPRLSQADLAAKLAPFNLDRKKHPFVVVGIRGYYLDTMGRPGVNDIGIYDDAIFIDSPEGFATFNGNTDPSRRREGTGTGSAKGMAHLKPGVCLAHKLDYHGGSSGSYRAICQRLGKVTVIRDGINGNDYEHTGSDFGINIHRGSYNGTSSLGCQTIHPDQWQSFISMALDHMKRLHGTKWESTVIPFILIEE